MLLIPLPALTDQIGDPSPGVFQSAQASRNLECVRMSQEQAHELHPGIVPPPSARTSGNLMTIDALACTPRIVRYGERAARDEAVLTGLRASTSEIANVAAALGTPQTVWHVDAFYPDARVASKIAVAARTELAEKGHKVSDRVPLLAAGDLVVMRDLPPESAYALACRRYTDEKTLGDDEAFLGIVLVDPRETQLHAGVCQKGAWRWVR